ncbi:hypothetical protein OE88DRAFT_1041024 [Heliocybe sulcata]|uniref:Uncharacterized protein n=1 Tax=Heliocybe sulcata TaxID=5364 RepID=A0A5C3ML89_9AGAM|nr:hypothetical protein OE88DRAFT_1041024 [Heliocybe sulcata]
MAPMSGIISASKLMIRYWQDVRNRRHLVHVSSCQQTLLPYFPSINSTLMQKRYAPAAKALVYQDKPRIPKSNIHTTTAAGLRTSALLLRTLNQSRLDAEDFVDLTGWITETVRFAMAPEQPRLQLHYFQKNIPFPMDAQGFLYWHLEKAAPPLSGQVRFRITTSSDPATFPSGRDLQLPDGRIWHMSLFEIARESKYSGLRAHLLSEKLVTAKVLDTALDISGSHGPEIRRPAAGSLLIWKFGQRFLIDLQSHYVYLWVIGNSTAERLYLQRLFSVRVCESGSTGISKRVNRTPFTGRALVQFECSTLPEHKGTRTVIVQPKEGGLAMARSPGPRCRQSWIPWSVDVDRPQRGGESRGRLSRALAILFDNELRLRAGANSLPTPTYSNM